MSELQIWLRYYEKIHHWRVAEDELKVKIKNHNLENVVILGCHMMRHSV